VLTTCFAVLAVAFFSWMQTCPEPPLKFCLFPSPNSPFLPPESDQFSSFFIGAPHPGLHVRGFCYLLHPCWVFKDLFGPPLSWYSLLRAVGYYHARFFFFPSAVFSSSCQFPLIPWVFCSKCFGASIQSPVLSVFRLGSLLSPFVFFSSVRSPFLINMTPCRKMVKHPTVDSWHLAAGYSIPESSFPSFHSLFFSQDLKCIGELPLFFPPAER